MRSATYVEIGNLIALTWWAAIVALPDSTFNTSPAFRLFRESGVSAWLWAALAAALAAATALTIHDRAPARCPTHLAAAVWWLLTAAGAIGAHWPSPGIGPVLAMGVMSAWVWMRDCMLADHNRPAAGEAVGG